jgi:hypothetical protein
MDIVSGLCHVEACGFHASCGVCSSDIKLIYIFPLDILAERRARQGIGFRLYKDVI